MESNESKEQKNDFMKMNVTLSGLLGILSVIVIPILAWAVSAETRLVMHEQSIDMHDKTLIKIENKLDKVNENTTKILIQLQNKEDKQ